MKLSLVLALALLGAVSAHQLHEGHVEQDGRAEQDEVKPGEQDEVKHGEQDEVKLREQDEVKLREQDEVNPGEQDEVKPGKPEPPCPTESKSFRMTVPGAGGRCYRYVAVNNCQRFWAADKICARCYKGRLASIHNSYINQKLRALGRCRTNRGQVWIGGTTFHLFWHGNRWWLDGSHWNYSNWAHGNPQRWFLRKRCVAMSTSGGHWRNISCWTRLPFICEY